jgi:hypothetical protein
MAEGTVKQHYVPCVLLSRFGVGDGRDALVWVWDKQTGRTWQSKVGAVAFKNDLYTLPAEAADQVEVPDRFPKKYRGARTWESIFQDLEAAFGHVVDLVQTKLALPPSKSESFDLLLRMLVILEMRTPAHIELMRQQTEFLYNVRARMEKNEHSEVAANGEEYGFVLPFDENKHILFAQSMQQWEQIVGLHHRRNWSLWVSLDADYVISDYPVSRCFARTPNNPFDSPAPAVANTLFMLPLGHGLMMAGDDKLPAATRLANPRLAAYHNSLSLMYAERFIYTCLDRFPVLWWEGSSHALGTIQSEQSIIATIDRTEFSRLASSGNLKKPRRWGVVDEGDFTDLVPPEHRISADDLARETRQDSG